MVDSERDGWILVAARWPESIPDVMASKLAQLEDPRLVRLYRLLSELLETGADDDERLGEVADIMASLAEQAYAAGELNFDAVAQDDVAVFLLDGLLVESDPRAARVLDMMRERGWGGWTRLERLAEPPG